MRFSHASAGPLALAFLTAATATSARAENTRATYPNALSVEAFGRGLLYGLSFDRVVTEDLAAGISYGRTPLKRLDDTDTNLSTSLVPVYINYYFMRDAGSLFATAGATLVVNNDDAKGNKSEFGGLEFTSSTPVLPTIGVGYEVRTDSQFLFRATGYGIIARTIKPWFGLTLGYAF